MASHDDMPGHDAVVSGNGDVSPAVSFMSACSQRPCQEFDISTPVSLVPHTSELAAIPEPERASCDLPGCVKKSVDLSGCVQSDGVKMLVDPPGCVQSDGAKKSVDFPGYVLSEGFEKSTDLPGCGQSECVKMSVDLSCDIPSEGFDKSCVLPGCVPSEGFERSRRRSGYVPSEGFKMSANPPGCVPDESCFICGAVCGPDDPLPPFPDFDPRRACLQCTIEEEEEYYEHAHDADSLE